MAETEKRPPPAAREVAKTLELGDKARAALFDDPAALVFLHRLEEGGHHADGVRFMAAFLPLRQALWWGCLCAWHVHRPKPSETDDAALRSVIAWLQSPSDELRRAAGTMAEQAGIQSPLGVLAQAVFFSGGSLLPAHLPVAPPPKGFSARAVAAAINSLACHPKQNVPQCYRLFLRLARELYAGPK